MSTIIVALGIALGLLVWAVIASNLAHYHRGQARLWQHKWSDAIRERDAEESLIFEWSCRDLMPQWEQVYPQVRNLPNHRKYSEWATFCANYPTREQIIAHLEMEGAKSA